ncbi:MAG: NYN domain-containing protein [Parachlamydiales bacterium]|nr:NYN domain-containing protein [Parachlamydiales bacterium]
MKYYIDGYNLLFQLFHCDKKLEIQRNLVIDFLKESCLHLDLNIEVVFDGHKSESPMPNRDYFDHLDVIYTPKNQTADDYILEQIFLSKTPSKITVISSDKHLTKTAKSMNSSAMSLTGFLNWLKNQEKKALQKKVFDEEFSDTSKNIKRLKKIFEEKLEGGVEDWD